ncbi:MAG TPA: sulfite exporter TauE/SafE family protein [Candidatus Dormibacteraeota bacterium]|nr:sulfite exporter TauE/SafE family protein [Candidatus Dormibacteraeota bacterium]
MLALGLLIGIAVGIVSGLVGIGGGVLLVPALIYTYKMSQHKAQGTSLATVLLPVGLFAFWEYYKAGNVDLRLALVIAIGFAAGAYFGGSWAQHLSEAVLRKGFAVLLAILAIKLYFQ